MEPFEGSRNNLVTRAPKALVRMARDNNINKTAEQYRGLAAKGRETARTRLRWKRAGAPAGHGATLGPSAETGAKKRSREEAQAQNPPAWTIMRH
jgi:hypothetical protein